MRSWMHPSGRHALWSVGIFAVLLVASNVSATLFWQFAGGVGLLDLDGGANLFQPEAALQLPPKATPARVLAILAAYSANARLAHALALVSLDLLFPAAVAVMAWATIVWACGRPGRDEPRWCRLAAGILAVAYLVSDWGENVIELLILAGVRGGLAEALTIVSAAKMGVFATVAVAMGVAALVRGAVGVLTWARRRRVLAGAGIKEGL
jgi:hypothetical protein